MQEEIVEETVDTRGRFFCTILIKQQNTAEYGQIVIALIDNERATLKRYWPDLGKGTVVLHPENRELEDRVYNLSEHEIAIQGVAKFAMTDL